MSNAVYDLSKIDNFCNLLLDVDFQNELIKVRDLIEKELKDFVIDLRNKSDIKLSDAIESRIKGKESLKEKIVRKDYISEWQINENIDNNKHILRTKLPDLIGLRITCYFKDDENLIFDKLLDYNFKGFKLHPDSKTNSNTNYSIKKVNGVYNYEDKEYNFEIQVKSTLNSIWSEIQHDTLYKAERYDVDYGLRNSLTENLKKELYASDSSLKSLYFEKYQMDNLLKGLFYELTKDEMTQIYRITLLGKHYYNFFDIMGTKLFDNDILQKYCGFKLLNTNFEKIDFIIDRKLSNIELKLSKYLISNYPTFYINTFNSLFELLFNKNDLFTIYDIISLQMLSSYDLGLEDEEDIDDIFEEKESKDYEKNMENEMLEYIKRADEYFKG